jgi:hypothetical protein
MPVWLVFGVQSIAKRTLSGAPAWGVGDGLSQPARATVTSERPKSALNTFFVLMFIDFLSRY